MVQVVKHPDTYICEVCKFEHTRKDVAELCETLRPLTEPRIKVGDIVLCESVYEGFFECTVDLVNLDNVLNFNNVTLDENGCIHIKREKINGKFKQCDKFIHITDYIKNDPKRIPHRWIYRTIEGVEVSKDGDENNWWDDITGKIVTKDFWNTDVSLINKLPEDTNFFIKCNWKDYYQIYLTSKTDYVNDGYMQDSTFAWGVSYSN